jgi:cytochrome c-type biogenesis protein
MTMAFTEPSRAVVFTLVYALGLAAPFLLAAALLTRGIGWLKRLNRHMRAVQIISGLLMVGVGTLLITGMFSLLNSYFIRVTPDWLLRYL